MAALAAVSAAAEGPAGDEAWREWVMTGASALPVVQNREMAKAGRVQAIGHLVGLSERKDLYDTFAWGLSGRYHFTEESAWEFLQLTFTRSKASPLVREVFEKTGFKPDVQLSKFQVASSYVYSPVYGKFAWGTGSLVRFDVFGTLGAGIRFARDRQLFAQMGLGMNNFIPSLGNCSFVPEARVRVYGENRSSNTLVVETLLQAGLGWTF